MNYQEAKKILKKKQAVKIGHNTTLLLLNEDTIGIQFYQTMIIFFFSDGKIMLNTDKFRTATTKARINEYSPIKVFAEKGVWYVHTDPIKKFEDGMMFHDCQGILSHQS